MMSFHFRLFTQVRDSGPHAHKSGPVVIKFKLSRSHDITSTKSCCSYSTVLCARLKKNKNKKTDIL